MNAQRIYKKPNINLARHKRAEKAKRGLGQYGEFSPYIQITRGDFPSRGRSEIAADPVTGRLHHFLSWLEYFIWLHLTHLGAVQIREQFPLGLEDNDRDFPDRNWEGMGTLSAAKTLGVKHPSINSEVPLVLTTDLLVSDAWGDHAVFIRYGNEVPRCGRQLELLKLHSLYWKERGIPHYVLTESDLDMPLIDLLIWAYPSRRIHPNGASPDFLRYLSENLSGASLQADLINWQGIEGLANAVDEFKAGVFSGQISVTATYAALRPLNRPWEFEVVKDSSPETRLQRFFQSKKAHDV